MNHQIQLPATRNTKVSRLIATALLTLAVFAMNGATFAQGVSPPLTTFHNVDPGLVVIIGTPTSPIQVDLDPAGLPWSKNIGDPQHLITSPSTVDLIETIVNVGTEAWTDWHEFLFPPPVGLAPDYWTNVVSLTVNGNPITYTATGLTTQNLDLFNFSQPVMPGDIFGIYKQVHVDGTSFSSGGYLRIQEYPTMPEPASLALFAMGGLVVAGMRRRR